MGRFYGFILATVHLGLISGGDDGSLTSSWSLAFSDHFRAPLTI